MTGFPEGYGRRVVPSVTSTLDEARRLWPEVAGPTWVLALQQTAARGRRGRAWRMPPGNFAATLVLREARPDRAALRSFVAALALRDTCVAVTGQERCFTLKWPNDVLLHDGKLAGILLETLGPEHLGIGIGVNLVEAPPAEDLEAGAVRPVALSEVNGAVPGPEVFLDAVATAYARHEARFQAFGFEPIRSEWLRHAARLGEPITARTMREAHAGTFVDVDAQGQLVLETASGRISIPAADIYF